ncbi:MAG: cobalamin-dependent protein, partial [Deltaproteobacteria bacterium]|nr:cobalamin-dependent protein [Deltaproteobacteria bacterium]
MTVDIGEYLAELVEAVVRIDEAAVMKLVSQGAEEGVDPLSIINNGLTVGLRRIGDLFAEEVIFLPELVLAGEIVTQAVASIKDKLSGDQILATKGSIIMATVQGDVHDIGKKLVCLLLSASGYQVIDLGKDVAPATIVDKVVELKPNGLGLSALLTTTMVGQKAVIEAIEEAGVRENL